MPSTDVSQTSRKSPLSAQRLRLILLASALGVALLILIHMTRTRYAESHIPISLLDARAEMAIWPWPHAAVSTPHRGVTDWIDRSSADGTIVHLIEFDFAKNPGLRFVIYDQDQDDAKPFDDIADSYWSNGVGQAAHHLNTIGDGPVVAAWNGLFYNTDYSKGGPQGVARHVTATVQNGVVRYNVGNYRWMFGVKYQAGRAEFKTIHEPDRATMQREFTTAAGGAECLIREGHPLKLHPYPGPDEPDPKQPVPSTPDEAGYIPDIDHLKTSRVSMGWSRDSQQFYLLFVMEPDDEVTSIAQYRRRIVQTGGWMVADEQRFWHAFGVWGAVNSDGGNAAQLAQLQASGDYVVWDHLISRNGPKEITLKPDFIGAPAGGSLMYFYVRDNAAVKSNLGRIDDRNPMPIF